MESEQEQIDRLKSQRRPRFHIHMVCPACDMYTAIYKVSCYPPKTGVVACSKCGYRLEVRPQFREAADMIWTEEDLLEPDPMTDKKPASYDMHLDGEDEYGVIDRYKKRRISNES